MTAGRKGAGSVGGFGVFLLVSILTLMTLLTGVLGAGVYRRIVVRAGENYNLRTTLAYVTGKVRALGAGDALRVERRWDDVQTLVLAQDGYETRIYAYDGNLYEVYAAQEVEFVPGEGQKIASAEAFSVLWERENLLRVSVRLEDETYSACVALHGRYNVD